MEIKMMVYDETGAEIKISDMVEINDCYGGVTGEIIGIYPHAIEVKYGREAEKVEYKYINSIKVIKA